MADDRAARFRVGKWVEKAEGDFTAAVHLLTLQDDECPFDVVCFHAHQCAEKYLKALLVDHGVVAPRTHDLAELAAGVPDSRALPVEARDLATLTPYAVEVRYPAIDEEFVGREEAEHAVDIARRVRAELRAWLALSS